MALNQELAKLDEMGEPLAILADQQVVRQLEQAFAAHSQAVSNLEQALACEVYHAGIDPTAGPQTFTRTVISRVQVSRSAARA